VLESDPYALTLFTVTKSGIVDSLLSWATFKQSKDLKKSDGTKTEKIHGIEKLDDANKAGGKESKQCTLILTEGDSAKALAVSCCVMVQFNLTPMWLIFGLIFMNFDIIESYSWLDLLLWVEITMVCSH
jgi:hypothetical protein